MRLSLLNSERFDKRVSNDLTVDRTRCNTPSTMAAERRATGVRLDKELIEGLQRVHARDGILPSEQVRRAVRMWLERKDVLASKEEGKQAIDRDRARRT
jgi:hypothetical protein